MDVTVEQVTGISCFSVLIVLSEQDCGVPFFVCHVIIVVSIVVVVCPHEARFFESLSDVFVYRLRYCTLR